MFHSMFSDKGIHGYSSFSLRSLSITATSSKDASNSDSEESYTELRHYK